LRSNVLFAILILVCAAVIGAKWAVDCRQLNEVRIGLASELQRLETAHVRELEAKRAEEAQRLQAAESGHKATLQNTALISGELAQARRTQEWQKRLAHDPEFAHSALERSILRMEKVGADPSLAARDALDEVARLATPPGSRIEVTNAHDKFAIRVAFKMSAVTHGEAGGITKHLTTDSMRREAREMSAHVIKELFDHCGARGIARLSVSCNHAIYRHGIIPGAATEAERKELEKRGGLMMACLYRVTIDASQARGVPDWRAISIPRVMQLMRVDYDGISGIKLSDLPRDFPMQEDPNMQLEF
jgi:hypothetical protein